MDESEELLKILQAHGQDFLSSFSSNLQPTKRKTPEEQGDFGQEGKRRAVADEEEEYEEWFGFEDSSSESNESFEQADDEFRADSSVHNPNIVVFSDSKPTLSSKNNMKSFMSSKVSKLREEVIPDELDQESGDSGDERNNAQNDALLHRLVHTKLLSGSLNPELDLSPAQRRKALAGRVLEVSGQVKLGKGEKAVREKERNKAAKRIREGLVGKQKERQEKSLEEAKNLGNYHPILKKLYDDPLNLGGNRKRERGLKMGVGKFRSGMLKLSREEINSINGTGHGARGRPSHGRKTGKPR